MNMKGWKWKAEQSKLYERDDTVTVYVKTPDGLARRFSIYKEMIDDSDLLPAIMRHMTAKLQDEINNLRSYAHDQIVSGSPDSNLQVVGFMNEKQ